MLDVCTKHASEVRETEQYGVLKKRKKVFQNLFVFSVSISV